MPTSDEPIYCTKERTAPLEVIVVGLFRTGTSSISIALKELGYTVFEDRSTFERNLGEFWWHAAQGKYAGAGGLRSFRLEQWESVFAGSTAITGHAGAAFIDELRAAYPNALVILTIRAEDAWYQSMLKTMWAGRISLLARFGHAFSGTMSPGAALRPWWRALFWDDFRRNGRRVFREHNAYVRRVVPPERLLVYDVSEGWTPLCKFLGKEVPAKAFPRINDAESFQREMGAIRRKAAVRALGRMVWAMYPVGVVLGALLWFRRRQLLGKLRGLYE